MSESGSRYLENNGDGASGTSLSREPQTPGIQALIPEQGNACHQSGCADACCHNIYFSNITPEDAAVLTQQGAHTKIVDADIHFLTAQELIRQDLREPAGVYISNPPKKDGTFNAFVAGACPNLTETDGCGIYVKRPEACRTFEIGNPECNDIRDRSLPLIPAEQLFRKH